MSRLLAISDIHGCIDTFKELIVNTLKLEKSDKLVLLGDYIDRGPGSLQVIDFIIDMTKKGFDIIPIAGNHEVMLLDALRDKSMMPIWLMNNGLSTLESFNVSNVKDIGKKYLDFFCTLKFFEKIDDFYFVHAGFNDHADNPFEDTHTMIWESPTSYSHPLLAGRTIIHGHRPKTPEFVRSMIASGSWIIPIDTGCVYKGSPGLGYLTALDVESREIVSVKNIEKS